jgi:hypothetical protein
LVMNQVTSRPGPSEDEPARSLCQEGFLFDTISVIDYVQTP